MTESIGNEQWLKLRSDIYIRDKGICWICNEFVDLRDYDLGHLIDRCNGGHDDYDNLAIMHHSCNLSKPRHTTLEEAMRWKLTPSYLTRSSPQSSILTPPLHLQPSLPHRHKQHQLKQYSEDDREATKQLIIEYFKNRPNLLSNGEGYNKERIIASKQLASTLDISRADVRLCLREAGLVKKRPPQITDGSQYHFVADHLEELLTKYNKVKHEFLYNQPKLMGISAFCMDIMFYLAGRPDKVSKGNFHNIDKRVANLNIPIRHILPISLNKTPPTKVYAVTQK